MIGLPLTSRVASLAAEIRSLPQPEYLHLHHPHHNVVVGDGEQVSAGQLLAQPLAGQAVAVCAPLAGQVKHNPGYISLHTSAAQPAVAPLPPLEDNNRDLLAARLRSCGVVGMGGAGYPLHAKLAALGDGQIALLIVNAAECDPHLASDRALMRHSPADLAAALARLHARLQPQRMILALEHNMRPDAANLLNRLPAGLEVDWLPDLYPAGSERQLVEHLTGKPLPPGAHPSNAGMLCVNVSTALAADAAIHAGRPLLERLVTVLAGNSSDGVYRLPLGTPLASIAPGHPQLRTGGAMMGRTIDAAGAVVTAATTGIDLPEATAPAQPCIRCGNCLPVCPERLPVETLWRLASNNHLEAAGTAGVTACIGCRACDVVCPSRLPLAATFAAAAAELRAAAVASEAAQHARARHLRHQQRLAATADNTTDARAARRARLRAMRGNRQANSDHG